MTYHEILEAICRHRANPITVRSITTDGVLVLDGAEIHRKIDEIEWTLQALTEKLRDAFPTS